MKNFSIRVVLHNLRQKHKEEQKQGGRSFTRGTYLE